jgi:phage shock protein PspC (stress-responsive transcriptional regulator)
MKKSLNINLGGIVFPIDEDAYERLNSYISAIERKFGNTLESKEIIADLESRMAELLQGRISKVKQSVDISDIDYLISVLGNPQEMAEDYSSPSSTEEPHSRSHIQRKLYRDMDNSILGGVCSGLGAYFHTDPVLFRILFLLLLFFGGASFIIYFILWIAVPAAKTPIQKMEMRGEEISINNLERNTRDFQEKSTSKSGWKTFMENFGNMLVTVFKASIKVIAVIAGVILVLIGALLILFFTTLHGGIFNGFYADNFSFSFPMIFQYFFIRNYWLYSLANWIIVILPILAIVYLGIKLLLGLKYNDKPLWISVLVLWIAGLILWIVLFITSVKDLKSTGEVEERITLNSMPSKTLYLDVAQNKISGKKKSVKNSTTYWFTDDEKIIGRPEMVIERSANDQLEIVFQKQARGRTEFEAEDMAKTISCSVSQKDSLLVLPSYFILDNRDNWRIQQLKMIVKIPVNQKIYLSKKLDKILIDADINGSEWIKNLPGNTWIMTENGLEKCN